MNADSSARTRADSAASVSDRPPRGARLGVDLALLAVIGAIAAAAAWRAGSIIPDQIVSKRAMDVYFEADIHRVFANMTDPDSSHYRAAVHPLYSAVAYPPTRIVGALFGLDRVQAVDVTRILFAALGPMMVFIALRAAAVGPLAAALAATALPVASAWIFWTAVPETFPLGAATMLVPVALLARRDAHRLPRWTIVSVVTASAAVTVTNAMAGAASAVFARPRGEWIPIALNAGATLILLWGVQRMFIPSVGFPLDWMEEKRYIAARPVADFDALAHAADVPRAFLAHAADVPRAFLAHAAVTPQVDILELPMKGRRIINTRPELLGAGGVAWIALASWSIALAAGAFRLLAGPDPPRLRAALGLVIAGQFTLHLVYGFVPFLYAAHWTPLLVLVAGLAMGPAPQPHRRWRVTRWTAAAALLVFLPTAAVNNFERLEDAAALITRAVPESTPLDRSWPDVVAEDASRAAKLEAWLGLRQSTDDSEGAKSNSNELRRSGAASSRLKEGS